MPVNNLKIGLEIHVHVSCNDKLFSRSENNSLGKPNTRVCSFDLGAPGLMPELNSEAVAQALKAVKVLGCNVSKCLKFDRKHYTYRDLPLGYQITQSNLPIGRQGSVKVEGKEVKLHQVHLEMDAAKVDGSLVDYNRAGVPLLEIVTEPDITSFKEFESVVKKVRYLMVAHAISRAEMSRGDLRCDVNVSFNGSARQEVKNVNSIRHGIAAIKLLTQLDKSTLSHSNTWGYNVAQGIFIQRQKETANDYCYLPEPDIGTMVPCRKVLQGLEDWLQAREVVIRAVEKNVSDETLRLRVFRHRDFPLILRYQRQSFRLSNLIVTLSLQEKICDKILDKVLSLPRKISFNMMAKILSGQEVSLEEGRVSSVEEVGTYLRTNYPTDLSDYLGGKVRVENFLLGKLIKFGLDPVTARKALQFILSRDGKV